jgi:metal-sulfur cluster biosynthetic enzyme
MSDTVETTEIQKSEVQQTEGGENISHEQAIHEQASAGGPVTREMALEALKVVKDPEIPVNIVDLGLVYKCEVSDTGVVDIEMTLTSVGCPVQDMIKADAELALMRLEGVTGVNVDFIWTPPWGTHKMTEDGKRQMRMFGFSV